MFVIKYGRALDRLVREVATEDLDLGLVFVLKSDVSYGFYRIAPQPVDMPKIGLVFPLDGQGEEILVIPLTLPMGWKN